MTSRVYDLRGKRIWVAGHRGMVGSAVVRRLKDVDCAILTADRRDLDLTRQAEVERWMQENRPQAVVLAAAKVGGIMANSQFPASFLFDNLVIETNIIESARRAEVERLLFLGSSCIYPRLAPQPIREDSLLHGPLEPTNEWYAIAKIAGVKLCQAYRRQYGCDFISAMPTNLFGPGDNYDLESSHVVPALLRKCHEAKANGLPFMEVWGTGTPRRELMYVDDLADALVFLLERYGGEDPINVGTGVDLAIRDLAELIREVVGYDGELRFDPGKPDGTPRKVLDVTRLSDMGWRCSRSLKDALRLTYESFLETHNSKDAS